MEMLEKRQEEELRLIKDQAKWSTEALEKQIQLMKEADLKAQGQLQEQLDAARANEKLAYKNMQDMKKLFEKSKSDAKDANLKLEQMKKDSVKAQGELTSQLRAMAVRDTQTNERLNDMKELWEEERREAAALRDDIRSLTAELVEANKPGFIRRIWRKIF